MPRGICTKCNRRTRGHSGPIDDECTLPDAGENYGHGNLHDLSYDSETSEKEKSNEANGGQVDPTLKKRTPKGKSDAAFAMKEVLLQLGHLMCTVQKIVDESKQLTATQKQQGVELTRMRMLGTGMTLTLVLIVTKIMVFLCLF